MNPPFQFDGYTLRQADTTDLPLAREWNAIDSDHTWELGLATYWVQQSAHAQCFVLEDATGPVFFFKAIKRPDADWIEVAIQFNRAAPTTPLWRTMNGMNAGMRWLEKILPANGVKTVYFSSKNERLIRFAVRVLQFSEVANEGESLELKFRRFRRTIPA